MPGSGSRAGFGIWIRVRVWAGSDWLRHTAEAAEAVFIAVRIVLVCARLLCFVAAVHAALYLKAARAFGQDDLIAVRILKRAGRVALKRFAAQAAPGRLMAARAQGFNRLQRSIAKLRVGIAAGADPIPQAVVPFVAVLAARALDLRVTDLAFLPVLLLVVLDHGRMVELLRRLVLFIAAVQAPGELLARLLTGGGVLYKFKAMTFFDLFFAAGADLAVLLVILLDLLDLPVVRLRLCDGLLALEAEFVAHHAVLCLAVFRLRVLARAELAAAGANGLLCAVRTGDGLPLVRDVHRTVEPMDTQNAFS